MGRILAGQCCLGGFLGKGVCAMMSRQWSSNTLKQGIDLLGSQCTDSQTGTADLDDMIRANWINHFPFQQMSCVLVLKNAFPRTFHAMSFPTCVQLRCRRSAFVQYRRSSSATTGDLKNCVMRPWGIQAQDALKSIYVYIIKHL